MIFMHSLAIATWHDVHWGGGRRLLFLQKGTHTIRISVRLRHFAGSPFLKGEPLEKPCDPAGVSFNSVNCVAQEAQSEANDILLFLGYKIVHKHMRRNGD